MSTWSGTQLSLWHDYKKTSLGLHSDNQLKLVVQRTYLVTYGDSAFSAAVTNLWNSIPVTIRLCYTVTTFKICIKTYLFNLAYPINLWFHQIQNIVPTGFIDQMWWLWLCVLIQMLSYVFYSLFSAFVYCIKMLYKFDITLHYINLH